MQEYEELAFVAGFGYFCCGALHPAVSHFFFGMIGGLRGALIVLGVRAPLSKSDL